MEFIRQYESSSGSEEEPPQQEASFSFSSKDFYNSNTVAPKGISLSTVRYEASENGHNDDHNEERCHSRVSSTVSDIDFVDYLKDPLDNIEHDQITDSDISIEGDGLECVPSREDSKMLDSDKNSDEESELIITKQQKNKNISKDTLDNIEHDDPHTDSDISSESEGSVYVPSKEDIEMLDSDKNSDEESKQIITKKKKKIVRQNLIHLR